MYKSKQNVLIFRNQLFKISESFIVNQASTLSSYNPIYFGRKIFGEKPESAKVISLKNSSFWDNIKYVVFRDMSCTINMVKQCRPALIHAHFGVEGVYAVKLAKELGVPLVTTFHGFDATTKKLALFVSGKPAWINYALHRDELIEYGGVFICVSEFIRKKVIAMGFPENKTITHYIGFDTKRNIHLQVNVQQGLILHVARLTEKKGTRYLIDAFAIIAKKNPTVKLVIIGDGPLEAELKSQSIALELSNRIEFLGAQPNITVMEWMAKADIFCLPSVTAKTGDSEGLGMVFLEAASLQVPIVATRHGGIPEAVIDNETGFLVPERSSVAIAEKIYNLLENRELRARMGKNALAMIQSKFNLDRQTRKLEEIYNSVLD